MISPMLKMNTRWIRYSEKKSKHMNTRPHSTDKRKCTHAYCVDFYHTLKKHKRSKTHGNCEENNICSTTRGPPAMSTESHIFFLFLEKDSFSMRKVETPEEIFFTFFYPISLLSSIGHQVPPSSTRAFCSKMAMPLHSCLCVHHNC